MPSCGQFLKSGKSQKTSPRAGAAGPRSVLFSNRASAFSTGLGRISKRERSVLCAELEAS